MRTNGVYTENTLSPSALSVMSNENLINDTVWLRDLLNVYITSNPSMDTKKIDIRLYNGSDVLKRPIFTSSVTSTMQVDRANVKFDEFSGKVSIDTQQFVEGRDEKMQFMEEASRASTSQIVDKYYKDFNNLLVASSNYTDREYTAGVVWTDVANANPYKDVRNALDLYMTVGRIPDLRGISLILDKYHAKLILDTDHFNSFISRPNIIRTGFYEEDLSNYLGVRVKIANKYFYGLPDESDATNGQIFDNDIVSFVWKDTSNVSDSSIIEGRNFAMDNSTFILGALDLSLTEADVMGLTEVDLSIKNPTGDQLIGFRRPVISTWEYTGINKKNPIYVETKMVGALFLNSLNKLYRIIGTV